MASAQCMMDMEHLVMHHMVKAFLGFDLGMAPMPDGLVLGLVAVLRFQGLNLFEEIWRFDCS